MRTPFRDLSYKRTGEQSPVFVFEVKTAIRDLASRQSAQTELTATVDTPAPERAAAPVSAPVVKSGAQAVAAFANDLQDMTGPYTTQPAFADRRAI